MYTNQLQRMQPTTRCQRKVSCHSRPADLRRGHDGDDRRSGAMFWAGWGRSAVPTASDAESCCVCFASSVKGPETPRHRLEQPRWSRRGRLPWCSPSFTAWSIAPLERSGWRGGTPSPRTPRSSCCATRWRSFEPSRPSPLHLVGPGTGRPARRPHPTRDRRAHRASRPGTPKVVGSRPARPTSSGVTTSAWAWTTARPSVRSPSLAARGRPPVE